jgi:hypothetical protein
LHTKLRRLGIAHEWHCGNGVHDWPYWARDLRATLPLLCRTFDDPPAVLTSFRHTSAEADYAVRGWTVHVARPAMEFTTLFTNRGTGSSPTDSSPTGSSPTGSSLTSFSLTGRGSAIVRTASWFRPGEPYTAVVDGQARRARADSEGRLTVPVPLGASPRTVRVTIESGWVG